MTAYPGGTPPEPEGTGTPAAQQPRAGAPDDPLEAFFARERDAIEPVAADELRWRRIVADAGSLRTRRPLLALRGGGSRWRGYAVGAAAAVVAVAGIWGATVGASQPPSDPTVALAPQTATMTSVAGAAIDDGLRSGQAGKAGTTPATPNVTEALGADLPPGAAVTGAVPAGFRLVSLSQADQVTIYGLGVVTSGDTQRPLLVASSDSGGSWRQVYRFDRMQSGGITDTVRGSWPQASAITQVRFANASVGYAFGRDLLRTTDGGRTWAPVGVDLQSVDALEVDNGVVVAVGGDSCSATSCASFRVARGAVSDASLVTVSDALVSATGAWTGFEVVFRPNDTVVNARTSLGESIPYAVRASTVSRLDTGSACAVGSPRLLVPASTQRVTVGLCRGVDGPGVGVTVARAGAGWQPVSDRALRTAAPYSLSATTTAYTDSSLDLIVASMSALDDRGSTLLVTHDGTTFTVPSTAPVSPVSAGGFRWVGAPGGRLVVAIPGVATNGYWRSGDSGDTWRFVKIAAS